MLKRFLCLFLVLVLLSACAAAEEPKAQRYDFDLTFVLNAEAFPPASRSRAGGYAELLNRLELRGSVTFCGRTESFDMDAVLLFKDKPDVSIPFRFYGVPQHLFLTSPVMDNQTILFSMGALLEFAVKAKNTLNIPLPYFAFLYPYSTAFAFRSVTGAWSEVIGRTTESCEISAEQLDDVSARWDTAMQEDPALILWISALAGGSDASEAVETEFANLPFYANEYVSHGEPLSVLVTDGSEIWQNAEGQILFSREERGEGSYSWSLTLPATESRYVPYASFARDTDGSVTDFSFEATYLRQPKERPYSDDEDSEGDEYGDDEGYSEDYEEDSEEYEEENGSFPETLLRLAASSSSIPCSLPADSSFSLSGSVTGSLFPNYAFTLSGETKKDGTVSVSLCKSSAGDVSSDFILRVEGTVVPGNPEFVPDYTNKQLYGTFNLFSFNEYYVALFKELVTKPMLKSLLDFVAEAPASACQSLLDDLTDLGFLNFLLD